MSNSASPAPDPPKDQPRQDSPHTIRPSERDVRIRRNQWLLKFVFEAVFKVIFGV